MAYRRSLTIRATLFNQHRFGPSFSYIHHQNDSEKSNSPDERSKINNFLQNRSFGSSSNHLGGFNTNHLGGFNTFFGERGLRNSMMNGSFLVRYMSTTIGDGAEKIEYITDVAGVLSDNTVDAVVSQAPAVSEVAVAAADSYLPVASLQYLIDGIHNYTGLPWWGSIAVATVLIRGLAVPLMINQLKATSKLMLMRPKLEEIKQEMQDRGMSPTAVAEGQQQMSKLFKEYGVTPWTPLKGILIQGPVFVSFFLGIQNMVDKVPSFKEGGAFWFTDLTTPDSFYILPVLTALSFWITVECNMQEGLEGNPAAGTMKNVSRVFAVLTVPITLTFPKAIFCYWITSNLFSLVYGLVIKAPGMKKFLGVPIIPMAPSTAAQQPAFSFTEALKKYVQSQQQPPSSPTDPSKPASIPKHPLKPATKKISSSSVLSQRIRSLENEVKGRKKGKKSVWTGFLSSDYIDFHLPKDVSRVFAVLTVPINLSFPKAIFFYCITSNLFSLVYGLVIKAPEVKKFLGVPIILVAPSTTAQQPAFSFTEALKKYVQSQQRPPPSPTDPSKPATKKISSSSVLSQRIRSLENEVKGRKKGKKR